MILETSTHSKIELIHTTGFEPRIAGPVYAACHNNPNVKNNTTYASFIVPSVQYSFVHEQDFDFVVVIDEIGLEFSRFGTPRFYGAVVRRRVHSRRGAWLAGRSNGKTIYIYRMSCYFID